MLTQGRMSKSAHKSVCLLQSLSLLRLQLVARVHEWLRRLCRQKSHTLSNHQLVLLGEVFVLEWLRKDFHHLIHRVLSVRTENDLLLSHNHFSQNLILELRFFRVVRDW